MRIRIAIGALLIFAPIVIDPLRGRPWSLGALRIALVVIGVITVALALASRRPRLRRSLVAFIALTSIGYACLAFVELGLALVAPPKPTGRGIEGLPGRTIEDPQVGFRSTPEYQVVQDDGLVRVEYRHNARGDRDDDAPVAGATHRILLLGDSFTYGQNLARTETIEARLEALGEGAVDAYNLGVPGYAAIHSLRRFEQSDWWRGDDVVYLFFNNDIHTGSRAWDYVRVVDGYPVMRRKPDGTPYTDDEIRTQLQGALQVKPDGFTAKLSGWLALVRLRAMVSAVLDRELRLTGTPTAALDPTVADEAVRDALAMRARAESIGARFHLVVIPTPQEGAERAWSQGTGTFVARAKAAGLEPHEELLAEVGKDDYLVHDGHFSAAGADRAARLLARITGR